MAVEWDQHKERTNLARHGVRFADAVSALEDENALLVRDERADEERWVLIGLDSLARRAVTIDFRTSGDAE